MKLQLNTEKIDIELKRLGVNRSWLANKMNVTRQNISYIFINKPITQADRIAKVLNLDPKDLIR